MKIFCLGDSLTYGKIGYSYIKFLPAEIKAVNKGKNGDTTHGAYKRLIKYLKNPKYADIDTYIVCIGANDIMLPYFATISPFWRLRAMIKAVYKKCITDDIKFEEEYEKYIKLLKSENKNIVLAGLPITELKNFPLKKVQKRNAIIKSIAERYNIPFVDTYAILKSLVNAELKAFQWGYTNIRRILDDFVMLVFPFTKDWLSKIRKLDISVDGAHLNSRSAKKLAQAVEAAILSYEE